MTYESCIECKKPFTNANVHTKDGWFETQISGMCEDCFDAVCKEWEGSEPDWAQAKDDEAPAF